MKNAPNLTNGYEPDLARAIALTRPGMAHFAATGPYGTVCGQYENWGYWRQARNIAGNIVKTKFRRSCCGKFFTLTRTHGSQIPARTESCRYFSRRDDASQPKEDTMSAYSDKIKGMRETGLYRVADFDGGKEVTHVIDELIQDVEMFDRTIDILEFEDSQRQLQLNVTNAETLITLFGDEPERWSGKRITLYLAPYGRENKLGIRIKAATAANGPPALTRQTDLNDEIQF